MPRPEAVLDAMIELMEMIQNGEAKAYKKYKENYAYYKANQDRVLKRTEPVLGSLSAGDGHDPEIEESQPEVACAAMPELEAEEKEKGAGEKSGEETGREAESWNQKL
jgi:hypothetical protein